MDHTSTPWPDEVERDRQQRVLAWRRALAERGLVKDVENDHNAGCSECKYEFAIPYRDESEGGIDSECIQCPDRRNDLCMRCCSKHSPAECPHWEPDDEEPDFDVDAALEAQLESHLEAGERYYTQIEQGLIEPETNGEENVKEGDFSQKLWDSLGWEEDGDDE
jgi:hypothetical protein